jgi:hypothetical protein
MKYDLPDELTVEADGAVRLAAQPVEALRGT